MSIRKTSSSSVRHILHDFSYRIKGRYSTYNLHITYTTRRQWNKVIVWNYYLWSIHLSERLPIRCGIYTVGKVTVSFNIELSETIKEKLFTLTVGNALRGFPKTPTLPVFQSVNDVKWTREKKPLCKWNPAGCSDQRI